MQLLADGFSEVLRLLDERGDDLNQLGDRSGQLEKKKKTNKTLKYL